MYKYVGLIIIGLFAMPAFAEKTCDGGTEITAHTIATNSNCQKSGVDYCNGKTFCQSNRPMNWWSAVTWCRANGRELARFSEACPNWSADNNICPNLTNNLTDYGWTDKISGGSAYSVDGKAFSWPRQTSGRPLALCE